MRRPLACVLAVALVVVACGDDDAVLPTGSTQAEIAVPAVIGESLDFALGALANAGLESQVIEVTQEGGEPGTIVEQVPEAGTSVNAGSTVVLTVIVAAGATTTTQPDPTTSTSTSTTPTSSTTTTSTTSSTTTTTTTLGDTTGPALTGAEVLPDSIHPESCGTNHQASAYLTASDPAGIGLASLSWEFIGPWEGSGSGIFPVTVESSGQLIGNVSGMPDLWAGGDPPGPTATVRLTWRVRDNNGNESTATDGFVLAECGL